MCIQKKKHDGDDELNEYIDSFGLSHDDYPEKLKWKNIRGAILKLSLTMQHERKKWVLLMLPTTPKMT